MEIGERRERKTNEIRGVLRAQLNPVWKVKKKGRARAQSERTRWILSPAHNRTEQEIGRSEARKIYIRREKETRRLQIYNWLHNNTQMKTTLWLGTRSDK
jgi:hypothetical protein